MRGQGAGLDHALVADLDDDREAAPGGGDKALRHGTALIAGERESLAGAPADVEPRNAMGQGVLDEVRNPAEVHRPLSIHGCEGRSDEAT